MTSYNLGDGDELTFTYNADGIRTRKLHWGEDHHYILNGTQILGEYIYEQGDEALLIYIYDETGSPIGLKYRNEWSYDEGEFATYLFEKNMQGDIVAIYNKNGVKVCTYTYDAWGNCTLTNITGLIGNLNPFRYRGYYYDTETGLYYLQSRYYNPQWGRFLNADGYINANGDLIGYNMFAYCSNNPVMFTDFSGEGRIKDLWEKIKNSFGAGSSKVEIEEKADIIFPSYLPITAETGVKKIKVVAQNGDTSKPVSVYAQVNENAPALSTVGIKITAGEVSADYSIGLDDIGPTFSRKKGDTTYNFGMKLNFKKAQIGIEWGTTQKNITNYSNVSINGLWMIAACAFTITGNTSVFTYATSR